MIRLLVIGSEADQWAEGLGDLGIADFEVVSETMPAAGIRRFSEESPDAVAIAEPADSSRVAPLIDALEEKPLAELVPIAVVGRREVDEAMSVDEIVGADGGPAELMRRLANRLDVDFDDAGLGGEHSEVESSREIDVERSRPGVDDTGLTMKSTEIPTPRNAGGSGEIEPVEDGSGVERRDYVVEPIESESPPSEERAEPDVEADDYIVESAESGGSGAVEPETPRGRPSRDRRRSSSTGRSAPSIGAEAIRRKLKQVRHEDYYTILEVDRTVGEEGVHEAYRELERRFNPRTLEPDLVDHWERELDEILDALDDARAVLGDDRLREAYLERTTRK